MFRNLFFSMLLLSQSLALRERSEASVHSDVLLAAQQAVVVTTPGWDDVHGTLQRYERVGKKWKSVGHAVSIVVGRSGMGWSKGKSSFDFANQDGPVKAEGDGRSPAGIFPLETIFSTYESAYRYVHMPFVLLTPTTECVDDEKSTNYNHIVDTAKDSSGKKDWVSSEVMLRHDNMYDIGITIGNNPTAIPGAGSCVFMHIQGPIVHYHGTAGCTALPADDMAQMFDWLNEEKKPVLIQMPVKQYKVFRKTMGLP